MTIGIIFSLVFAILMFCNYLVKDYRKGVFYTGIIGFIQRLIKH